MSKRAVDVAEIRTVIAELEELDRRFSSGYRGSVNHSLRLWADGAKHALQWVVGAERNTPVIAIELLELALRPEPPKTMSPRDDVIDPRD
jgi:hypothetical protein